MANDAHIDFAGYVATDPVYWQNENGRSRATLRVAYTPRYIDRNGEWTDSATTFVTVTCWRKLADNVAACLRKGTPVLVRGRLQVRRYDDREGNPRTSVDVDAQSIGYDLSHGIAWFQRTRRVSGDTATAGAAAGAAGGAVEAAPLDGGDAAGEEGDDVLDDSIVDALLAGDPGAQDEEEIPRGGDSGPRGADAAGVLADSAAAGG